jgi:hypothetical protein
MDKIKAFKDAKPPSEKVLSAVAAKALVLSIYSKNIYKVAWLWW